MKRINSLESLPENIDILTGIDLIGNIKRLFKTPAQMPGCLFLLCIRGNCSITIHLSKYELKKNSIPRAASLEAYRRQAFPPAYRHSGSARCGILSAWAGRR